jgi:hypothetical protein
MKKTRGWVDEGAVESPEEKRRGTYPPDIARRRRQLGLPVTPADHAAYERGEYAEPQVSAADEWTRDTARRAQAAAWWKAHWAAEDARTGRWRTRRAGEEG